MGGNGVNQNVLVERRGGVTAMRWPVKQNHWLWGSALESLISNAGKSYNLPPHSPGRLTVYLERGIPVTLPMDQYFELRSSLLPDEDGDIGPESVTGIEAHTPLGYVQFRGVNAHPHLRTGVREWDGYQAILVPQIALPREFADFVMQTHSLSPKRQEIERIVADALRQSACNPIEGKAQAPAQYNGRGPVHSILQPI